MRSVARVLLVLFVFSIPWEYSLDVGAPFGNVARILGVLTLLMAAPAVLRAGRMRRLSSSHWLALASFAWICCTLLWTLARQEGLAHLRGYAQEMALLWLVWEFVDTPADLRVLLRAWLAGSWILAILTIAEFASADPLVDQVRFAAVGQDPNDVSRFLVFGFPIAALLLGSSLNRMEGALALMYFPVGFAGILLTASRSGLLAGIGALTICGAMAVRRHFRLLLTAACTVVLAAAAIFVLAPTGTFERLGTAIEIWQQRDLNERVNIWSAGLRAFERAPIGGHGLGSFVTAAEVDPEDTAHNTALSIMVEEGLGGLGLAVGIVGLAGVAIWKTRGPLRFGLSLLIVLWAFSSFTGTLWENRATWLLFGVAIASGRMTESEPGEMEISFGTVARG